MLPRLINGIRRQGCIGLSSARVAGRWLRENSDLFLADLPNSPESGYNETANFAAQGHRQIPRIRQVFWLTD
jgi:hypothetical protein